ncbi:N-acetyltransferase [Robertkochia marina]|uniref:N-acetyltransferase n=1 Tax=Robertkochia marina TaxID=1227945 RepID=A0A4S3LWY9_9FLAO|nr:GNAT family N-acetyltransferase [Robertkochia marina]THD65698.1 N-acetyltransferase [Robertkochia marina]TRZ46618.1 N-acetyltransferase [Robertkochia marina]
MKDMLVRLVALPNVNDLEDELINKGIVIRRPIAPEKSLVSEWVKQHFSEFWANEVEVAFSRQPVSCFVAQKNNEILGFSCYETTAKAFFGPTGTVESARGQGIGKVLLIKALQALKEQGYAYGIIGGVGPEEYYRKTVNAVVIEGSETSVYENLLRRNDKNSQ